MSGRRSGQLAVDAGQLRYEVAGHGEPIVFIHGFSLDMRSWDGQFETLADEFRLVRYDLRGFGESSLPERQYDHCDDLARLLAHLDIERPLLVGLSLGANIALRFTTLGRLRPAGIVLASPGLAGHVWQEERPPEAAKAFARHHGVEAGKEFWLGHPLFASLGDYPGARAAVHAMVADYSGWHWREDDPQAPAEPVIDLLDKTDVPTLVLSGDRDANGYREIALLLSERMPAARLVTFGDCGHMLNLEEPEAFNAAIRQFAASVGHRERSAV